MSNVRKETGGPLNGDHPLEGRRCAAPDHHQFFVSVDDTCADSQHFLRGSSRGHQRGRRWYLAGQLYGLRSRLYRSWGEHSATLRKPFLVDAFVEGSGYNLLSMEQALTFNPRPEQFFRVIDAVHKATNIMAITGAGISAESGLRTFRGEGGWWRSRNPEELATLKAFEADPKLVWEWYEYRREVTAKAEPNAAHQALSWLESEGKRVFILTQNVDDLHERAGSHEVVHIHGSIWHVTCMEDGKTFEDRRVPLPQLPPICTCGGILRPAIVWFDEDLSPTDVDRVNTYLDGPKIDVVLVIGTYVTFEYIRDWALRAKQLGALLIEINPDETTLSPYADVSLRGKAGEVLASVQAHLNNL
jgi:NAD-dependent deacetylase